MFGPYTDAILLTLSTICIMCTILILVVFCLKRRKDEEKATADIKNIEMMHMEQQTESTKDSKENESGSLEKVVEGNGDILTTDRLNIDADIRNRGGTFDSMPSHTTISNNSPQMMHQQSLPNYSNNVSMQPSFPASFSAAQNYLNISYPNGNSNYRHGSYANEYSNYSHQNQPSPLPAISVMSNTEHNLILPTNASMMNGSYSSSIMNNGDPVLLRNLSSNISAFSQMVPISHNPSMISSYSMHQSQVQQSSFPQQSPLPLNAGISLPVMKQRRKSSDANSEMGDNATPGLNIHNNDDTEEKVFEDGLHIVYDHNQESQEEDEHNSDAMSENSDATSEEGIDIIYDDEPGTPDDDAFKQMNDCDLMSPGAGRNQKDEYASPGRVNKNKHVKFNIHSNNDSIYNEDDAQSVVGGVTDIGNQ